MKNKHIEIVKKWLADKNSVSPEELDAAADDAAYSVAYDATGTYAAAKAAKAANAADAAANATDALRGCVGTAYAADAAYWVKRFEELTK
tara:strand:- start:673 stop:942 length:270 start_codon:yes stop_codon:yes gene_type:complete